jgi:hypothetical protein
MNSLRGSETGGYAHLRVAAIGNAEQSTCPRSAVGEPVARQTALPARPMIEIDHSAILVCHAATHSGIFTIDAVEFCDLEPHGVLSDLTHSVLLLG